MEQENLSEFEIKVEKVKKLEAQGEKAYKAKFNKTHEIHNLEKYELTELDYISRCSEIFLLEETILHLLFMDSTCSPCGCLCMWPEVCK